MSRREPASGPLGRAIRSLAARSAHARPRRRDEEGAERRVSILLMTAYGIDGTIRTTLNLAGYLASRGYEVKLLSVVPRPRRAVLRRPAAGRARAGARRQARRGACATSPAHARAILRRKPSVLSHPDDRADEERQPVDRLRLGRALRRRTGFLISTRPGLNLAVACLAPPGLVLIGQEHMHLGEHSEALQEAMPRAVPEARDPLGPHPARSQGATRQHLGERPSGRAHPEHRARHGRRASRPRGQDRARRGPVRGAEGLRPADPGVGSSWPPSTPTGSLYIFGTGTEARTARGT